MTNNFFQLRIDPNLVVVGFHCKSLSLTAEPWQEFIVVSGNRSSWQQHHRSSKMTTNVFWAFQCSNKSDNTWAISNLKNVYSFAWKTSQNFQHQRVTERHRGMSISHRFHPQNSPLPVLRSASNVKSHFSHKKIWNMLLTLLHKPSL